MKGDKTTMENKMFVRAAEVAADYGISEGMAYRIIRRLNSELEEKGYITVAGRVSRRYYEERTYQDRKESGSES